jgi:hypothetical protein
MAKVLVEYTTHVQRIVEVPDDLYEAALDWDKTMDTNPQKYKEACAFFDEKLWGQIEESDPGFIYRCGIYTPDGEGAISEY